MFLWEDVKWKEISGILSSKFSLPGVGVVGAPGNVAMEFDL